MASIASSVSGRLHHRQASGLVREGKPIDAVYFNFFGATVGPVLAWTILYGIPFYPGANILVTILITFAFCIGINVAYAYFSAIMPRSGGDYVFISRTFHPVLGFAANASFMFWLTFYLGTGGALVGQLGLAPAFRMLGKATSNPAWASWGDWFLTDWGKFISGISLIVLTGPLVLLSTRGLRTYFRYQKWVFAFCAATFAATIIAALIMSHNAFVDSFNSYAGGFSGSENSYDKVIAAGGAQPDFSWGQTFLAATWPFYGASFIIQSAYWAGEHRTGLRSHLTGMTLTFGITFVMMFVGAAVALKTFGGDFLNAIGLADPAKYGMNSSPYFAELTGSWTGPVIGIILCLGLGAWFLTYVGFNTIMITRCILAWSFDGVVPGWLGRVDARTSNPINATIATWACAIVLLALYSFTSAFSVVTALLGFALTFFITCIAAIAFPFRRPDLFEGSAGATRVWGIPVLSIAGLCGALGSFAMIVIFLRDPSSGTNWPINKNQVLAIFGALFVAAAIYGIAFVARRRRGIDITDAYKELPPE